jgi:hypothetical protein
MCMYRECAWPAALRWPCSSSEAWLQHQRLRGPYSETCNNFKSSVTSCARLPNYFKINLFNNFYVLNKVWISNIVFSTSKITSAMFSKKGNIYMMKNIWQRCKQVLTHGLSVVSYYVEKLLQVFWTRTPGSNLKKNFPKKKYFVTRVLRSVALTRASNLFLRHGLPKTFWAKKHSHVKLPIV